MYIVFTTFSGTLTREKDSVDKGKPTLLPNPYVAKFVCFYFRPRLIDSLQAPGSWGQREREITAIVTLSSVDHDTGSKLHTMY